MWKDPPTSLRAEFRWMPSNQVVLDVGKYNVIQPVQFIGRVLATSSTKDGVGRTKDGAGRTIKLTPNEFLFVNGRLWFAEQKDRRGNVMLRCASSINDHTAPEIDEKGCIKDPLHGDAKNINLIVMH